VEQPECLAIVRAAVGIGATLGMSTTAEGVETADQLAGLLAIGCGEAQGFLFSRPAPGDEVPNIFESLNQTFAWGD
jgi:EAL domain-containing protein (putative c-di-GMP-specific phosphodiesterase class I)